MIPYCVAIGSINEYHIEAFRFICKDIRDIPHKVGKDLTCHDVCFLMVRNHPDLEHIKGKFNHMDHSWLQFKRWPWIIIDPYPWACASGPMLLTTEGCSPWRFLYKGEAQCLTAV